MGPDGAFNRNEIQNLRRVKRKKNVFFNDLALNLNSDRILIILIYRFTYHLEGVCSRSLIFTISDIIGTEFIYPHRKKTVL